MDNDSLRFEGLRRLPTIKIVNVIDKAPDNGYYAFPANFFNDLTNSNYHIRKKN